MLKSVVKKAIYMLNSRLDNEILPRIESKSIISFDVFDTLIKRDVATPIDVFFLMERKLQDVNMNEAKGFAVLREKAEQLARENHPDREVTLQEIYGHMPFDMALREKLMLMECQIEIDISIPNIPMKRLYDACLARGKRTYFISDMYLPTEVIWKILKKNGYANGKLYVSSENGLTKRSGKLFSHIQKQENLNVHQWVHIGDAIYSDYFVPKKIGIQTFLINHAPQYNKYIDKSIYRQNSEYRQLNHFIDSRISRYKDPYEQIGYAVLGPLLYGFSKWLEREIPDDETIVFLAREGALLQRAFKAVSKRQSVYLHTSRRAIIGTYLSQAENFTDISQEKIHAIKKCHTQKELAMSYGLSIDEIRVLFKQVGLRENDIITSSEMEKNVLKVIWSVAREKSIKQREYFVQYIKQLKLSSCCAIIDVGWRGTTQYLLDKLQLQILGERVFWDGYYMGINKMPRSSSYYENKKQGFLYDKILDEKQKRIQKCIISTIAFFEILFLSTSGSTKAYQLSDDGNIIPVLDSPDNDEETGKKIVRLQNSALEFVSDFANSPISTLLEFSSNSSIGNYVSLAIAPTLSTLDLFRDFKVCDGDEGAYLVSIHGMLYYLLHPRQLKNDFLGNECKAWFLKSVFKLPLPYILILDILRFCFYKDDK